MKHKFLLLTAMFMLLLSACTETNKFVYVENGQFVLNNKPYYFVGTNFWYGPILGSEGEGGNRERLHAELDSLSAIGVTNLRVLVGADGDHGVYAKIEPTLQKEPGVYNEELLDGLDYFMAELGKRNMHAVLYLNNSWEWSGGYSQYLMWAGKGKAPIPALDGYQNFCNYVTEFVVNEEAQELFANHVKFILGRTNKYTGLKYTDDPAIFSWQIGNEPRAFSDPHKDALIQWTGEVAELIRSLDKNHMISTGNEGEAGCEWDIEPFERMHAHPDISYITIHMWPYNWSWFNADDMAGSEASAHEKTRDYINRHIAIGEKLGKPIALEEFGMPRDSMEYKKGTPTTFRDRYYSIIFDIIKENAENNGALAGCNFWAWGGMVNQSDTNKFWVQGDDYCGDPAQEAQGLNSVFMTDKSTIGLIQETTKLLNKKN